MDRVLRQKNVFIAMALQLDKQKRLALKPLIDIMCYKIDLYLTGGGDRTVLDSLYYLLVDATTNIQQDLVITEIGRKLNKTISNIDE